jgi:hypothetical protein
VPPIVSLLFEAQRPFYGCVCIELEFLGPFRFH